MGVWWRGEAVGDTPIPPDKTADHDIGDGMYLTDTKQSAVEYTMQRTSDPSARRLYSVGIDTSQMRVLDLTTDARWLKDINMVEPSIKAANVNYGRIFKGFLEANKINLNDYDAVIGLDYLKGGKQICILYKNGAPTRYYTLIRSSFVSESVGTEQPMDSNSIAKRLPSGGGGGGGEGEEGGGAGGGGFGAGATIVGVGLFNIAAQLIGSWLFKLSNDALIKNQFKDMEPKIQEGIREHAAKIASLQSSGKKAYANITVRIDSSVDNTTPLSAETMSSIQQYSTVYLEAVFVSGDNVNLKQRTETKYPLGQVTTSTYYTYSAEVTLSQNEVAFFVAIITEYNYYAAAVKNNPGNAVFQKTVADLRYKILILFGQAAAVDVLDAWMWPTFKYKGTPIKSDD